MSATFAAQTGQQSPSLPSSMSSSYLSDKDAPYTSSSPQEKQLLQPLQQQQQQQQQSQPQHKQPRYYKDNKASISNSHDDNNSNSSVDNDHDSDNSDDDDDDDDDQPAFSHEFDTAPTAAAAAAATTTTTMTAAALRTSSGSNHNAAAARVSGSSSSSASSNNGSNTNNNVGATINKMRPHTTKAAAGGGGGWGSSHANNNNNNSNNNNASSSVSVNAATAAATTATAAPHSSTSLPSSSSSSPQQQQPRSAPRAAPAVTTSSLSARHADANSTADIVQRAKAFVRSDTAPSTAAAAHAEPRRGSDAASGHAYAAGRVPLRAAAAAATTSSQLLASHANNNSSSSSSGYTGDSALASTTTTTLPSNSNAAVAAAAAATSSRVLAAPAWVDAMALSHLLCEYCHHVVSDPVQCFPGPRLLCRRCAAQLQATGAHATAHELPAALVRVVHEVLERARLLRGDWPLPPHKASATTSTSNGEEAVAQRRRAAPTARADAAVDKHNNNKTAATSSSTSGAPASRERVAAPQSPSSPPPPPPAPSAATATATATTTTAVAPSSLPLRVLEPLAEAEASERGQIATQHQRGFAELERHARRARAAASGPTSRQLKIEADRLYEATHYDRALDYYTRAIALQRDDQQAQLPALYGNRSAANFMAHRYAECVADCLAVVELDHDNVKMYSRAARAAATMGDLAQAVAILEKAIATTTSSSSSSAAAAQQQQGSSSKHVNLASELAKYKQGLELLQKATQQFGSAEGDVHLRMLIAQFADTVPFRVRYAESLMQQRQHLRAYDVLDAVAPSSRPPSVTRRMAECLYLSGFEHFERARRLLSDDAAAANDAGCARLLQVLDRVDEGKQSGNNNFAQKRFSAAVDNYTAAIGHATGNDQILRILYCNRAAANKEIGRYREGIDDCTRALAIDPDFFKAYARRARCHQHLGDHYAAVQDFKKALQYEAGDSELARELRSAEYHLAKEAEREKDYYYQLGLTRAASEREVKVRYRELSLRWHPDKCVNLPDAEKARAEHKFKVISEAYAVLSDPVKRRDFDRKYDLERYARNGLMSGATSMASGGMGGGGGGAASYTTSGVGSDMYRATGAHARHRSGPGGLW